MTGLGQPRHDFLPVIGFGAIDVVAGGLARAVDVSGLDRGARFANQVETVLEYERRGTLWRNA